MPRLSPCILSGLGGLYLYPLFSKSLTTKPAEKYKIQARKLLPAEVLREGIVIKRRHQSSSFSTCIPLL